jgi:outer membrane protein assembly factor BamB
MYRSFCGCVAFLMSCTQLYAEDWLSFRGPNGSGVSASSLPASWTPTANIAWKSELPGPGVSSPIIVGSKLFLTCYSGYGIDRSKPGEIENLKRHLICFDANNGKKLWQKDLPAALPEDPYSGIGVTAHGYASHTPVSDGESVFVFFGKSGALAFNLDGEQLWQTNLGKESDPWAWGSSSSPILYENTLIVTASAESQSIVGLDKKSGKELWRQEASGLDGMWGTPTLVRIDDKRTDLVLSVPKEMWGLNPKSGKLIWRCNSTNADQSHSSAISLGDTVVAFSGRGGGSIAVRAGGKGDVTESNVVWTGRDSDRFASPVGHNGNVYLVANGMITAINGKTGEKLSQLRLTGGLPAGGGGGFGSADYGSPVIAGNKLYYTKGTGETFVFDLTGELKQLSVNLLTTEKETFGGSPAVSNGKIYIRSDKNLYCVTDLKQDVPLNASASLLAKKDDNEPEERPRQGGFGGGPGGGGGGGRGGFDPAAFFKERDKNSDGKLSVEEVAGSPMADRFSELDKDKDQGINLEEFRASMQGGFGGGRGGAQGGGGRGGFGGRGDDKRPKRDQRPAPDA